MNMFWLFSVHSYFSIRPISKTHPKLASGEHNGDVVLSPRKSFIMTLCYCNIRIYL